MAVRPSIAMVGILAFCASLASQQITAPARMIVFGGPYEPPINQQVLSQAVKKPGIKIGWNESEDGTLIYATPKQMSYVFFPSLRELTTLKMIRFFREKLEKGGPNQVFAFSELPEPTKAQLLKAFPNLDISDQSSFTFNLNLIPQISGSGRSIGIPLNFNHVGKAGEHFKLPIETMTPIKPKDGAPSEMAPRPIPPTYQIWPVGTLNDTNRTEMMNEALTEFKNEVARRNKTEVAKILEVIKDEQQVKAIQALVGQGFKLVTQRTNVEDIWAYQLSLSLRGRRNFMGLQDDQDWNNFIQHAQIDSLSAGFSLFCVQLVNGQRRNMSFEYSL